MQKLLSGLLFLLFTCIYSTGWSQLYLNAKLLTTANGLSDNRITAIYKDARGYIWIGTKNGLNKYNGQSFTIYKPGRENSISNEIINCITGDKEGNIWVGTMNGLNRLDAVTNTWTNWLPDSLGNNENNLHNFLIWDLKWDESGVLWIACDIKEFTSYNPSTRKFEYYDWPGFVKTISGTKTKEGYHAIQSFVQKNRKEFWLASNKGLVHLNTSTRKFTFVGGNYYADIIDIQYDSASQQVWVSLEGGQVFRYKESSGSYEELFPEKEPYPSSYLPNKQEKETWIASEQGLLKAAINKNTLKLHRNIPSLSFSLPPGGVTTTYIDSTGIGWIGTPNGLFMQDQKFTSSSFLPLIAIPDREGTNRMGGVFFDEPTDTYYVCSYDPAGLFVLSRNSEEIQLISKDNKGKELSPCYGIKKLKDQLWLITRDRLYRINKNDHSLQHFPTPVDGEFPIYRDLELDNEGVIWITSFNQGVLLYDTKVSQFSRIKAAGAERLNTAGTSLAYDSIQGNMWIGTYGNYLVEYSYKNKTLQPYYEKNGLVRYANLNLVHDLEIDSRGRLWVATNAGGIYRHNPASGFDQAFSPFDMRNGLKHNQFIAMAKGEDSILWLLSETGLSYINIHHPDVEHLVQNIQSISTFGSDPRYPHGVFYNGKNKEVGIAVAGGMLLYHPQAGGETKHFPLIVRKDKTNIHSFSFDALYYGMQPLHFEYQLTGLSEAWNTVASKQIAFQNLSHGSYSFRIRAKDSDGNIITTSSPINFSISAPLWKQPWFLFTLILAGIGVLFLIIEPLRQKVKDAKILNQFATSLYGKTSIDDIFWDVALNCVRLLGFEDCVIYQYDPERKVMVQRAAAGPKSPHVAREIINHLEIPLGKGIVGTVAQTGKAERIGNTARDSRYLVDDQRRNSEITIPIWVDGQLFGIIDSEHSKRNFFKARHSRILKNIAQICAERISKYITEERLRSKISRDLHDEMGSTLTSINILSKVAMSRDEERAEVVEYLQKIKDYSGNMMESMSDIIWAINPANDSLDKVLIKMKEFAAEMLEPVGINYYFDTRDFSRQAALNLEERKDLYLVFKEAINNIVKYSKASEVNIVLRFDKEELSLTITDNGQGFDSAHIGSGNGINNMKTRAKAMGAEFRLESIPGTGTSIFLKKTIT